MTRQLTLSFSLLLPLVLSSCIVIGSSTKTSYEGTEIGKETYKQVMPGKKKDFVEALFGKPTTTTNIEGGEIWKWTYRKETRRSSGVIFLISSKSETETQEAVYVEFHGDAVHKVWRDS